MLIVKMLQYDHKNKKKQQQQNTTRHIAFSYSSCFQNMARNSSKDGSVAICCTLDGQYSM